MDVKKRIACVRVLSAQASADSKQGKSLEKLAEAFGRFSPEIALRAPEIFLGGCNAVFLDLRGTQNLYTEAGFLARAQALSRRLGFEVRTVIAPTAALAWVQSQYPLFAQTKDLSTLPLEALVEFARPFGRDLELQKKFEVMSSKLIALGVNHVGQFLALPSFSLASRFGQEASELSLMIQGDLDPPWTAFKPLQKIIESSQTDGDDECEGVEPLLFILKGLLDSAMARLCGRGERASVLRIELKLARWSILKSKTREFKISLPVPQGSVQGLLPILRDRLMWDVQKEPLIAPVESVWLEILEALPGHGAQRDFFHKKEEEAQNWEALYGRLIEKLGQERVFYAQAQERYLPEKSWRKVEVQSREVFKSMPFKQGFGRPSRILKTPEPVAKQGSWLQHLGSGKRWGIRNWEGPERISTEWWESADPEGVWRDYYRVLTQTGEKLWIFMDASSLYLHGFFD